MRSIAVFALLAFALGRLSIAPAAEQWSLVCTIAVFAIAVLAAAGVLSLAGQLRLWLVRREIRRMQ